jgi:predicted acylesterase/phospholipase RssA
VAEHEADATRGEHAHGTEAPRDGDEAAAPSASFAGGHRPRWRDYTAFVLSGGGARGALQVGALRALFEAEIKPDVIVGTSIGAWNGALLAWNPTLAGIEAMEAAWREAHPTRVLLGMEPPANAPSQAHATLRTIAAAQRVAAGKPSLYGNVGVREFIQRLIGEHTFEELAVPLRVVATDITHGTRAVFDSGPLAPAVLASSAIPGVFPPVRIGDSVYVDGGSLDNASVETALTLGARRIFVLEVGYDEQATGAALWSSPAIDETSEVEEAQKSGRNGRVRFGGLRRSGSRPSVHPLAALLERTSQVVSHYQLEQALARVPRGIEVHVIRVGHAAAGGALEFEKAPRWMEQGYAFTRAYLASAEASGRSLASSAPASPA